ncbi:MAG: hypothetical protein WCA45_10950 [Thiobacillaceae bacterium]
MAGAYLPASASSICGRPHNGGESRRLDLDARVAYAQSQLEALNDPESWRQFIGTLGADPLAPIAESQVTAESTHVGRDTQRPTLSAVG